MTNQEDNKNLSLKRYAARLAMEGEAEKARREEEERIAREKELLDEAKKQKELDKKAAEERALKDKKDAEERERRSRAEATEEITGEIKKIKSVGAKIETLRTLKGDMDEMIKSQSISLARIAMEEDARRRASGLSIAVEGRKNWAMIIISVLMIASGLGIAGYVYLNYRPTTADIVPIETVYTTFSPIATEYGKNFSLEGLSQNKIISDLKGLVSSTEIPGGSIQKFNLIKKTANGKDALLKSQEFFTQIRSGAPGDLTRSLKPEMIFGVANTLGGAKSGILIFEVESYQNAFAGMLNWEKGSLVKDVFQIITSQPENEYLINGIFEDLVVNNQDTRILRNENQEIALIYGFLNGRYLVITGNTEVFNEIIARFRNAPI